MIAPGLNNPYARGVRGLIYLWVAALVLLLYPYTEDPAAPIKHLASAIAAVLACAVWAVGVARGQTPFQRPHATLYALLAFLGTQVAAATFSETTLRSFDALQPWFGAALIALVASQTITEPRHLRNLFRAIVFSVAVSTMYAFFQSVGLDPFPWGDRGVEEYRRLPATYGNPNLAGHAIVIALVLCMGLGANAWIRGRRKLEMLAYIFAALIMFGHLYLTGMRGGMVALAFAGFFAGVYGVLAWRGVRGYQAGMVATSVTVVVLAAAIGSALLLAAGLDLDSSLQLRLNGYAGAAAMFHDHFFTGIGPGNYATQNIPYWTEFEALWYALENKRNFNVHNEWLEIAVASGLPGIAAFVALFLFGVHMPFAEGGLLTRGNHALALALPAALVAVAVDACSGFNLHVPVSGALFMVLVVLCPGAPATAPSPRGYRRGLPLFLIPLALCHGAATWRVFEAERLYQQAQGALVWAREQQAAGHPENAAHGITVARESLDSAFARTPYNHKIPMRAGDLELERGNYTEAISLYKQALDDSLYLPRIRIQLARSYLRLATGLHNSAREQLLGTAASHASDALAYSPMLAEAWAMKGWANYFLSEPKNGAAANENLVQTVDALETARRLGMADDIRMNAALGAAYGRLGKAAQAAERLEVCALAEPDQTAYWDQFAGAALAAEGDWPMRYRQALLHAVQAAGVNPSVVDTLVARLARVPASAPARAVIRTALADVLRQQPEQLARWGAWLGTVEASNRAGALANFVDTLQIARGPGIPESATALLEAVQSPNATTMARAGDVLLQALATAPGGERESFVAQAHLPLINLLEHVAADSHLLEALQATTRASLGAACFEAGLPTKADALLQMAEKRLPAGERGLVQYYRSRALLALDQPEAALAFARQAADGEAAPIEYRWQLARCMDAAGNHDAAAFLYASLLAALPSGHPYGPLIAAARDRAQEAAP